MSNNVSSTTTSLPDGLQSKLQIMGLPLLVYTLMFIVLTVSVFSGVTTTGMLTGFAVCLVWGGMLSWIGSLNKHLDMLGAPALLCMFAPAILYYVGLIPQSFYDLADEFYTTCGFIDFFIAALIAGSILSMDRNLLIRAGTRYAFPLIIGVIFALLASGLIGMIGGYGFKEAIRNIAIPIMGGGVGAGAIPISQMFAAYGASQTELLSALMPAVTLGNLWAILVGGAMNPIGAKKDRFFKGFSGQGNLMMSASEEHVVADKGKKKSLDFATMGVGLLATGSLYVAGKMIQTLLVPSIHAYAWTILLTVILKIANLVPQIIEDGTSQWYGLMSVIATPAILVCSSLSAINITTILESLANPVYLVITLVCVIVAFMAAGFAGRLVKMNFVEAGITAGLCMANMGGGGDIAVLGAAKRMNLMAFAQISSRLGGALMLLITSFLAPWLMG